MKKSITTLAAVFALGATSLQADELSISSTFAWESEYVFRGLQQAKSNFQPSIDLSYGPLYTGFWSMFPVRSDQSHLKEFNFYTGYQGRMNDWVNLDFGATMYYYPNANIQSTQLEPYFGGVFEAPLSPTVYFYHNFRNNDTTLEASIGHGIDLGNQYDLHLGGHFGHVWRSSGTKDYAYAGASADLSYSFTEWARGSVGVRFTANDLSASDPELQGISVTSNLWWGFSFTAGF